MKLFYQLLKKLAAIISPCTLALAFCLVVTIVSLIQFIRGEAFADLAIGIYLVLSFPILLIDIVTKKLTKNQKIYYWPLQVLLLTGLFFATRSAVGGMFSAAV